MQALSASLGVNSTQLSLDYMAPLAWALIRNLAAKLDKLVQHLGGLLVQFEAYKKSVNKWCETQINLNYAHYNRQLEHFKKAFIDTIQALRGCINNFEISL
jgi:hypothetical protein